MNEKKPFHDLKTKSRKMISPWGAAMGFLLCSVVFAFFGGCHRPDPYAYPLNDEVKTYCVFDTGSWWVYIDSNKGLIDTVRCFRRYVGPAYDPKVREDPMEVFNCTFQSTYYDCQIMCLNTLEDFDTLEYQQLIGYFSPPNYIYYMVFFSSAGHESFIYNGTTISRRDDIGEVNGFKETRVFEVSGQEFPSELPYLIAWAPHIGIVHKAMPDGINWQLIDYHVKQ